MIRPETNQTYVAYYRVSTKKQGLGLDAQQEAAERHCTGSGGRILASYQEKETGKRKDRPELLKALAHCRATRSVLLIAKLDRLARNVAFTSALMESGVEFVCCDSPHATKLTIHILAAVAEDEADRISERTKAGLAQIKRRIQRDGSYTARNGRVISRLGTGTPSDAATMRSLGRRGAAASAEVRRKQSHERLEAVRLRAAELREGRSLTGVAEALNGEGYLTARGSRWGSGQVCRLLSRQ